MTINLSETGSQLTQRVAKTTIVVLVGQLLSLAANFGVTLLLARHLGESGFGQFSYALVIVGFFAIVADFGMKPIVVREISRQPEMTATILGNALILKFVLCLVAVALTVIATTVLKFSSELRTVIWVLTGTFFVSSKTAGLRLLVEAFFHARLRMEAPLLFQTIDALLLIVLTVWAITWKGTLTTLVTVYVLSNLPGFVLSLFWLRKAAKPNFLLDKNLCRMLVRESLPLLWYTIVMMIYDRIDVVLLEAMRGQEFVGLYAAAYRLISPLIFIPTAVITALYPLMSQYGDLSSADLRNACVAGLKILSVISLAFAIGATVFTDQLFHVIYPQSFAPAAMAFKLLMWTQVFLFLNFFFTSFNTSINRQRLNFWIAVFMAAVNVGLDLILIPLWDVRGAGIAKLATNIAGLGVSFWFSYREIIGAFAVVSAKLLAVSGLSLLWLTVFKDWHLLPLIFSVGVVYSLLLLAFGVFDAREKRILMQLARRAF